MATSRQTLAIGDTGAELITKFNNVAGDAFVKYRVFNVEDYGAVHDGVTDDTSAIQDAINACSTAKGGIVYFPAGIYILDGALQNGISITYGGSSRTFNFNSQLYIPPSDSNYATHEIILMGEGSQPYVLITKGTGGRSVILKSTIAGSGTHPSVIAAGLGSGMTYPNTYAHIKNITILVEPFVDSGGPSMSGVNFYYADHCVIDNLYVSVDLNFPYTTSVVPTSHVFGLMTGMPNGNFPIIKNYRCSSMYYGLICGDGVHAYDVFVFMNYIGVMSAFGQQCGSVIDYLVANWNAYDIAAQQETLYGTAAGETTLFINHLLSENNDGYGAAWHNTADEILDTSDYLYGYCNYFGVPIGTDTFEVKANGGKNLLTLNKRSKAIPTWTTANRPTGYNACMGYNITTGKAEVFDGSNWHDLY